MHAILGPAKAVAIIHYQSLKGLDETTPGVRG